MLPISIQINQAFYSEEIRSGFTVTQERKELWAVELDLLSQLDLVCKKNNLTYCVGAGTMLGAVRHQGFIPWDDDIDIYMPRKDYDKLVSLNDAFHYPYFLQNPYTEKNLLRTYSRLRNSLTTGTTKYDEHRNINKGIFIDICPIDGVSDDKIKNGIQRIQYNAYRRIFKLYNNEVLNHDKNGSQKSKKSIRLTFRKILVNCIVRDKKRYYSKFEKLLRRYSTEKTAIWGNRTLVFDCPKSRRPISDYTDIMYLPFEFLYVPVPKNYDSMLRQQYGDYMIIPENKGGTMHGELIISSRYAYDDPRRL